MTPGERAALAFVCLVLLLQVAVPAGVLLAARWLSPGGGSPAPRYGWQMFTDPQVDVKYEVVTASGTTREVDASPNVVHYGDRTLIRLCAAVPHAVTVNRYVMRPSGREVRRDSRSC